MPGAACLHVDVAAAPGAAVASSPEPTVAWSLATPAGARTVTTATTLHLAVVAAVGAVLARGVADRRPVSTHLAEQAA